MIGLNFGGQYRISSEMNELARTELHVDSVHFLMLPEIIVHSCSTYGVGPGS